MGPVKVHWNEMVKEMESETVKAMSLSFRSAGRLEHLGVSRQMYYTASLMVASLTGEMYKAECRRELQKRSELVVCYAPGCVAWLPGVQ